MTEYRRIFKTKNTGKSTLKELLLGLFVSELFNPSPKVWIVSPWISDIVAIDNTGGSYNTINPDWSGKKVLLSDVIIQMLSMSTKVYVISNLDVHNKTFFEKMEQNAVGSIATTSPEAAQLIKKLQNAHVKDYIKEGSFDSRNDGVRRPISPRSLKQNRANLKELVYLDLFKNRLY